MRFVTHRLACLLLSMFVLAGRSQKDSLRREGVALCGGMALITRKPIFQRSKMLRPKNDALDLDDKPETLQ